MDYSFGEFADTIDEIFAIFFSIFSAFFITNEWLRIKNKVYKIFPYFFYTISIPVLVSVVIFYIKNANEKHVFNLHVNLILATFIIALFLAIVHYLKYNFKAKTHVSRKIAWKTTKMYKSVLVFTLGLSFVYVIFVVSYFMRHSTPFYDVFSTDMIYFYCIQFVVGFVISCICWYLVLFFYNFLSERISFFALLLTTTIGIFVIMQFALAVFNFVRLIALFEYGMVIARFDFKQDLIFLDKESVFIVLSILSYQFFYFHKTYSKEQLALKSALSKQMEQYESLRRQLSPHFLFNNINVLTALIEEDPKRAVHFSESLGNIYRHFLRQEDEDVVTLQKALTFSKNYLELLKYRFEDAFQYVLPKEVPLNQYIIPLALQQVIENTIKHNELSKEKPLQVIIEIHKEYISIQNTKQPKHTTEKTKGIGIENIQKRYAFLTEKEVIIEETETNFTIKLPILNMEKT
jgi:sensor histidine kinase YesM